ncbi:Nn.00g050110.m01.CDS01 [Neocucurbitaria sp. VM-36]
MTTKTKAKNQEDRSQKRSASRTIPRASKLQKISLHLSDDDDDNEDMQSETEWRSTRKNDEPAAPDSTASKAPKPDMMACLESEIELKINPYRTKLQGQTIRVSTEKLCQELEAVKAEIESVRRLNAQLERELNDEREASHAVAEERDQLRVEVDLSRSQQKELSTKYKDLQHRHEQVQTDHETILEDIIKAQDSEDNKHTQEVKEQMKTMKDENARLARENEILKAAATPSSLHRSTTSPAPSSVSSDKEQKTENIRRTYVKVKRRYDHLHKAANDLSMCTRSTDLSCFGEVGQCLKHLRTALEEDSHERQALLVHEQNQVGK